MTEAAKAKIVHGGRVVLPAAMRRALGLNTGDTVFLELDGDELRIRSARASLKRVQDMLRPYLADSPSVVDELIAERRAEAARE